MRLPSLRSERPATVATAALEISRDPKRDALVHGFFLRVDRRLRETIRVGERHNAEIERPDFGKYQQRHLTRRSDRRILTGCLVYRPNRDKMSLMRRPRKLVRAYSPQVVEVPSTLRHRENASLLARASCVAARWTFRSRDERIKKSKFVRLA